MTAGLCAAPRHGEDTEAERRHAEMSSYRRVTRICEGWQVFVPGTTDAPEPMPWRTVVKVLRIYSPLNFVRLELEGGMFDVLAPSDEVRCRTLAEVKRAGG